MSTQPRPLEGIRVIDYSHFLAGPYIGRCLAALGAEVIKVERPTAGDAGRAHAYFKDGQSGYFLQQNMGKEGLCVNLKDQRGLELLHKLVATADVFVENYRPGALDKLGLGYKALSQLNPKLVYCSVSAYGHTGPDSSRPGFGLIAEAKSGAMAMVGVPAKRRRCSACPIADMYAGSHGVAAICAALVGRANTGRGQHIDMALYDCMISIHDYAVQCYTLSRRRGDAGADRPRPAAIDRLWRVPGPRRLPGHRRAGRRRVEAAREADRRRGTGGRRALPPSRRTQRRTRGDPGEGPRLDDGAAVGQGVHRRARRRRECPQHRCRTSTRCWPTRRSPRAA